MITALDRQLRRKSIGSSDAPAIVGCDPWKNAADVYYSKIGRYPDVPSEAMQTGNRLERVLLDLAEERLGKLHRDVHMVDEEYSLLTANLDGLADSGVVEAKYVGPKGEPFWGEQETDQVPDHVAIQVQHQLRCSGRDGGLVVAAICRPFVGLRFEFFEVRRDDELIDDLVAAELAFWENHVAPKVPPRDLACLNVLRRLYREPASVVDVPPESALAIEAWENAKAAAKECDQKTDYAYQHVLALLGDAEAGRLPDGRLIVYGEENAGLRLIDAKEAQENHPELFEQTTRRVLRIKKGKK